MEEDVGVKGTVTRLRRRLSVEKTEEVSSPATPTKKRGGRLAAKPQLELIEENAQISSPKKTRRKSLVKDVADAEEKPVTPSRRSTRIKSNTSIISETVTQTTDSPRARRALRRTSQAGSDNEGPATPARQTRRTRKDSASSVENQEPASSRPLQVVEMVIAEEPEAESANKSKSSPKVVAEELSPNSARKSKRLSEKRNRRSGSYKSDNELSASLVENKDLNISAKDENSERETKAKRKSKDRLNKSGESNEFSEKLSESNTSLLKTLNAEPNLNTSNHNKSVPSIDYKKTKRNRTESWPMVLTSPANDNIMLSDNEQSKKKKKKSANNYSWMNNSGSSLNNTSVKDDNNKTVQNDEDDVQIVIESPSKRKKRKSETSFSKEVDKTSELVQLTEVISSNEEQATSDKNIIQKPEIEDVSSSDSTKNISANHNSGISSDMAKFFEKSPSNVQAIVYFEDSDSNSVNIINNNAEQVDSEDQCVPVVKHDIKFQETISPLATNRISKEQETVFPASPVIEPEDVNNSCEPMDIDETIHEEILLTSQNSLHTSTVERKSLSKRNSITEEPNKSKRKSSISAIDTSKNENKTTLILSQLKDVSTTSDKISKSPKLLANEILSKSTINGHDNNEKVAKTNLSLNDLKGTPLKPINMQKLAMQTSTPLATQQVDKTPKSGQKSASSKNASNHSNFSESIDESRSSEEDSDEASGEKSNLVDDEAEEASDDYESGDSRDEEERQYEDEHEIIERGETLGSEEDLTNDSDYERDSFVVSSDAEDDDLLSGSGDDLSMSDKELSMSKKSKKKYNERKLKEQKNASREMFESRHKLDTSEKESPAPKTKNNRMRIDSSLLESDEEIVVKPKKNNRLRLDSTHDASNKLDDVDESLNKSSKKSNKSMQKSICNESAIEEKEMTIFNESVIGSSDPLQVQFKQEPKTPQKDLNMSVVQFTSRQDIENVEVDEGKSILNQTEMDPLLDTPDEGNTSDSSENEEIIQNYDSVLNELNKSKKSKLSSNNLSLNMDKKTKNKREPLLDQLNLTHTKKIKKNRNEQSQDVVESKPHKISKDEQESDRLSEGNLESGDDSKKEVESDEEEKEVFVPLRKSTGKTNIVESVDDLFFIDTTGAQDNEKEENKTIVEAPVEVLFSSKKKQKKNKDSSQYEIDRNGDGTIITEDTPSKRKSTDGKARNSVIEAVGDEDSDGAPVETPYQSEKASNVDTNLQTSENTTPAEPGSGKKKKKKKKKQSAVSDQSVLIDDDDDAPVETPYQSEKASDLEANLQLPENTEPAEPGSGKKKKKKKKTQAAVLDQSGEGFVLEDSSNLNSKKRKRKSSDLGKLDSVLEDAQEIEDTKVLNESLSAGRQKKKRKISYQDEVIDQNDVEGTTDDNGEKKSKKKKKKNRDVNFQNIAPDTESTQIQIKKNKKRKERDEDTESKNTKVSKENSFHEVHMPPLPASILSQLDDKPRKIPDKPKVISTAKFVVENARQKRAKPSKYLEESIYLDANSPLAKKDKSRMRQPKVLPFIPTASISESGFTTNFQIKKMSQNIEFVAGPSEMAFSKEKYLQKKEIKRLGTYDLYKKQISRKLSKF